jgi:starch phosphorylase
LGAEIIVSARIALNGLSPEDVAVQVLMGRVDAQGEIKNPVVIPMQSSGKDGSGVDLFQAVVKPSTRTGLHGYSVRVLPQHLDLVSSFLPELILWSESPDDVSIKEGASAGG